MFLTVGLRNAAELVDVFIGLYSLSHPNDHNVIFNREDWLSDPQISYHFMHGELGDIGSIKLIDNFSKGTICVTYRPPPPNYSDVVHQQLPSADARIQYERLKELAEKRETIHYEVLHELNDYFWRTGVLSELDAQQHAARVLQQRIKGEQHRPKDGYLPDATSPMTPQERRRKGGRPPNPDDDWAFKQIYELGRLKNEVYTEWLTRIGQRAVTLADPQDSFDKAMAARRKEEKEETEKTD